MASVAKSSRSWRFCITNVAPLSAELYGSHLDAIRNWREGGIKSYGMFVISMDYSAGFIRYIPRF